MLRVAKFRNLSYPFSHSSSKNYKARPLFGVQLYNFLPTKIRKKGTCFTSIQRFAESDQIRRKSGVHGRISAQFVPQSSSMSEKIGNYVKYTGLEFLINGLLMARYSIWRQELRATWIYRRVALKETTQRQFCTRSLVAPSEILKRKVNWKQ